MYFAETFFLTVFVTAGLLLGVYAVLIHKLISKFRNQSLISFILALAITLLVTIPPPSSGILLGIAVLLRIPMYATVMSLALITPLGKFIDGGKDEILISASLFISILAYVIFINAECEAGSGIILPILSDIGGLIYSLPFLPHWLACFLSYFLFFYIFVAVVSAGFYLAFSLVVKWWLRLRFYM